jgi:hypothetical protein
MTSLLPVVEGPGDEKAVPELMRRALHAHDDYGTRVLRPHNVEVTFPRCARASTTGFASP